MRGQVVESLRGNDDKIRIVLNKSDQARAGPGHARRGQGPRGGGVRVLAHGADRIGRGSRGLILVTCRSPRLAGLEVELRTGEAPRADADRRSAAGRGEGGLRAWRGPPGWGQRRLSRREC